MTGSRTATVEVSTDACVRCEELRFALHKLLTGDKPQRIRYDKREVEFTNGNAAELRKEIERLERECNHKTRPRYALRAGPYSRRRW